MHLVDITGKLLSISTNINTLQEIVATLIFSHQF